jgi:hypothetical protein
MTVESETQSCPRDGKPLVGVGNEERFLECSGLCGFGWDSFLSKEVTTIEVEPSPVTSEQMAEVLNPTSKKANRTHEDLAVGWLGDPALLGLLCDAITIPGSADELVGEDDSAAELLLVLMAELSAEIRGDSGAGKSALAEHVLSIFPEGWVWKMGGLTDKAVRYLPDDIRIMYIAERRGMESGKRDEETTAAYDVKLGISDKEISVAIPEKDPDTERFVTQVYRHKVGSFVLTTTEITAPPQLENRLVVLYVKDDVQQNELVRDQQLSQAEVPSWDKRDPSDVRGIAREVIELVFTDAPEEVILPFAEALKPLLRVEEASVRRHTPKVRDLIKASAKLHYQQREIITGPNGEKAVVASPADLAFVLYTSLRSFESMLGSMPEKAAKVLQLSAEVESSGNDVTTGNLLLRAKDKKINLGKRTVQAAVKFLNERGNLIPTGEKVGRYPIYQVQGRDSPLLIEPDVLIRNAWDRLDEWKRMRKDARPPPGDFSTSTPAEQGMDTRERTALNLDATRPNAPTSNPNGFDARREVEVPP